MAIVKQIQVGGVQVAVEDAPPLRFPSSADCNSPVWWWQGQVHVLTSTGHPRYSSGPSLARLAARGEITYTGWRDGGRWIESVHQEADGTLFGWYHNEPAHYIPDEYQVGRQFPMTAPFIGAAASYDNGLTWDDLGLVLAGGPESLNLEGRNYWFAGGNGDFTVLLDRQGEYFYFLFGTYYRDVAQQGISLARMRADDRPGPVGRVSKWHQGAWQSPGLNGPVTPIIPVTRSWYDPAPDTFWGPSVHWNHALETYVILMNRAIDPRWKQGGIYVSLAADLADPATWTEPHLLLEEPGWYPQVIGDEARQETDRLAGATARLFIHGESKYQLLFSRR